MALRFHIENETNLPDGGPVSFTVTGKRIVDIGRDRHLDWTLPDPARLISGKHCEVHYRDGGYWLHDVSTNGTFLNGADQRMRGPHRRNPMRRELATAFLGLVPSGVDPQVPEDTRWHPLDALPELAYDHEEILLSARERLRAKLSYTNLGFALAPPNFTLAELRDLYAAALGHQVSATNLQRVLLRRRLLEDTGERRHYGAGGGRPAAIYRFRTTRLEITDQFAVLRPPTMAH